MNRYPGAKRRRRRNSSDERGTMQWSETGNLSWKRTLFTRMRGPSSLGSESFADHTLRTECSILDNSSVLSQSRSPATITVIADIDDQRISSAVSVRKVSQAEIAKMDYLQKAMSKKNSHGNPLDNDQNSSVNSQSTVKVVRVKKVPHMDEIDESNLNDIPLEDLSARSRQSDRVPVTRVYRSQSSKCPRPRASSASGTSVIHVHRSLREVEPRVNQSRISRTRSAVIVKRVPRQSLTARSNEA